MSKTRWEHRRGELIWSIGILTFLVLAEAVIIIVTDGKELLPIAGACVAAMFLVYEVIQLDVHERKKPR